VMSCRSRADTFLLFLRDPVGAGRGARSRGLQGSRRLSVARESSLPGRVVLVARSEASSAIWTLPCFGRSTGMSGCPLVRRATAIRSLALMIACSSGAGVISSEGGGPPTPGEATRHGRRSADRRYLSRPDEPEIRSGANALMTHAGIRASGLEHARALWVPCTALPARCLSSGWRAPDRLLEISLPRSEAHPNPRLNARRRPLVGT
jgi:hypothetical protein